jgi:hypothetical protein
MTSISLFVIHPSDLDRNRQNLAGIAAGESDEQPIEHRLQVAVSTGAARSDRPGPGVGQWPFF